MLSAKPVAPPKLALQGNKWVIENFTNDQTIVIDKAELKHVVYVYNCNQCTIQIQSKVNAVTIGKFCFLFSVLSHRVGDSGY